MHASFYDRSIELKGRMLSFEMMSTVNIPIKFLESYVISGSSNNLKSRQN